MPHLDRSRYFLGRTNSTASTISVKSNIMDDDLREAFHHWKQSLLTTTTTATTTADGSDEFLATVSSATVLDDLSTMTASSTHRLQSLQHYLLGTDPLSLANTSAFTT